MSEKIEFSVEEVLKLYKFLEDSNDLFHQPINYQNSELIESFAADKYPIIRDLYYYLLWGKLPKEEQEKIINES